MSALRPAVAVLVLLVGFVVPVKAHEWQMFEDPALGYRIPVPVDVFSELLADGGDRLVLRDGQAVALLEVVGGVNQARLSVSEFGDVLSRSDRIAEVTYRQQGRTWLVLSGYYSRDEQRQEPLVFYAKFMFSPDLARFAGFEMSYPQSLKPDFDPLVEVIEDGFRGPRSY